ncbi:CaiB/BaiF CoA transferase family protein [Streptomyces sp. enrichment culture]|uniref:CaiB/BaiF CoA transferase family protein n=1 Tax=Streptomyces sp. enrichment culture TaxID=1795815 RepID=UPI003F549CB3
MSAPQPDAPSPTAGPEPTRTGPLSGLLVADFSRVLAGPYATMLLADLGAEVVKVESPGGDDTRTWLPPVRDGVSTYYLAVNRNKHSVTLDFKDPDDLAAAQELAARADVVIENFKPGGLRRFGLDYDSVRARNADVVYASISGFGTGAGASLPGYDLLVQAMSGLMSLTGDPDGRPYRAGISVFDVMTGMHAAIGILSALHHRAGHGQGQHIEVNLLSSALSALVNHTSAYVAGDTVPLRMGNAHPSLFPYEPLPTADKDLIVIAGNDGQFRRLCQVLGLEELVDDPRFLHNEDRTAHREELRPHLVGRLKERGADEWFDLLTAAGLPAGPINTVKGGVEFAERLGLRPVVEVGEGDDMVPSVRNPITFSATPASYLLPPPRLGQHTEEIRSWLAARPASDDESADPRD